MSMLEDVNASKSKQRKPNQAKFYCDPGPIATGVWRSFQRSESSLVKFAVFLPKRSFLAIKSKTRLRTTTEMQQTIKEEGESLLIVENNGGSSKGSVFSIFQSSFFKTRKRKICMTAMGAALVIT